MEKVLVTVKECEQCKHLERFDSKKSEMYIHFCHNQSRFINWYNHDGFGCTPAIPDWCPLPDYVEPLKKE